MENFRLNSSFLTSLCIKCLIKKQKFKTYSMFHFIEITLFKILFFLIELIFGILLQIKML